MKMLKKIHPILIALFPPLTYYASNSSEALLNSTLFPILWTLVIALLIWRLMYLLIKKSSTSGVLTSGILIWFFSYEHIQNLLKDNFDGKQVFTGYLILLVVTAFVYIKKGLSEKRAEMLSGFLTIMGIYLVISSTARIIPNEVKRYQAQTDIQIMQDEKILDELDKSLIKPVPAQNKPDIYYIIPDRYARADLLEEFFEFDNSEFIQALVDRGFYVAEKSNANYPKTFLSMASSLNLRYLNALTEIVGENSSDNTPVFEMVQNNTVSKYLQDQGYSFIYSGGWWEPTRVNKHADLNINLYANSGEFLRKYGQTTVLNPLFNYVFKRGDILGFSDYRVRENHYYKFEQLKKVANETSPKFVLVHMLFPHSPYVFDAKCNPYETKADNRDPKEYIAQLQCSNTQLLEIIDSILSQSQEPPVIILQADEGPFKVDEMNKHGEGIDWTTVSNDATRHHMGILNAYYIPAFQEEESPLYPEITPVNSFRLIFNEYFGTQFEVLEDRSYIIPHLNYPYQFIEVTNTLVQ